MGRVEWMKEELKRIRGVTELPKELLEKMERCMPSGEPVTISIINFMTTEEMDREEERVRAELWEKLENLVEEDSDGELMIYREEDLTKEEIDELPAGALVRRLDESLDMKYLDMWAPIRPALKKPEEPLTKYGRMRLKFLEQWRVKRALEWDRDLLIHCLEIQRRAKETKQRLMEQLQRNDPPPSRDEDPMAWVGHMNALELQAEEIVTRTIVYA